MQYDTDVLPAIRKQPKTQDLGALAVIYSEKVNLSTVIQPMEKFLFLREGRWWEMGEDMTRINYMEIKPADMADYANPMQWVLTGPFPEDLPGGMRIFNLYRRQTNSNLYKPTA